MLSEIYQEKQNIFPVHIINYASSNKKEFVIECHQHDELEFLMVLEGSAYFNIEGSRKLISVGDIVFIPANTIHSIETNNNETIACTSILFDSHILYGHPNDFVHNRYILPFLRNELEINNYILASKSENGEIIKLFSQIRECLAKKKNLYEFSVKSYLFELVASTILISEEKEKALFNKNIIEKIKTTMIFMDNNYANSVSVERLAESISMSTGHYTRMFKKITSCSPIDYLLKVRLSVAVEMLTQSNKKIMDISLQTGFNNVSYFIRAFKNRYDCTPSEYRKNNFSFKKRKNIHLNNTK